MPTPRQLLTARHIPLWAALAPGLAAAPLDGSKDVCLRLDHASRNVCGWQEAKDGDYRDAAGAAADVRILSSRKQAG